MLIQCTQKLLTQLKIKPEPKQEDHPLFAWHAHLLTIKRRKTVVFINDSNRYVIVLYGLLAKDFKRLDELMFEAIKLSFKEEGVEKEVIEQFLQHSPHIRYTKSKDRSSVARMNKSIESVHVFNNLLDNKNIIQTTLSVKASEYIVGDGKNNYIQPNEKLINDLNVYAGKHVIKMEAVQIKATLILEHFHVWRRLIVPIHFTFHQLHQVLQTTFHWQNYHLHEFYIYKNAVDKEYESKWNINHPAYYSPNKKPILNIVSNEEAFDYGDEDIPIKLDKDTKLSEYFPSYEYIRYNYDFGADWRHNLEIESFTNEYDKSFPVCLEGEGATPPEDVGGEQGYIEFLNTINKKTHPEHEQMITWGNAQGYREFNIKNVNLFLKSKFILEP